MPKNTVLSFESEEDSDEEDSSHVDDNSEDSDESDQSSNYEHSEKRKKTGKFPEFLQNPDKNPLRIKTPHFPSFDYSEIKGLDLIKVISLELDHISTSIESISTKNYFLNTKNPKILAFPKPKKRVITNFQTKDSFSFSKSVNKLHPTSYFSTKFDSFSQN